MKGDKRHFTGQLPAFVIALFWSKWLLEESTTGKRKWTKGGPLRFFFMRTPRFYQDSPGDVYVIPHLQKKARWGIFLYWPFGLNVWAFWKMQKNDEPTGGGYVPNSEEGIYFRLPGYRWDKDLGMITTGGRVPGGHWD